MNVGGVAHTAVTAITDLGRDALNAARAADDVIARADGAMFGADGTPTLLDPDVLTGVWSGRFGANGYTAIVDPEPSFAVGWHPGFPEGRAPIHLDVDPGHGTGNRFTQVRGTILDGRDQQVGYFLRNVTWQPNEAPVVWHEALELAPHAQRTGFAREFNERAFERYADLGVHSVRTTAIRDGGVAWADDFQLAVPPGDARSQAESGAATIRTIVRQARADGRIGRRELRELEPLLVGRGGVIRPDTLTGVAELKAHRLGPRVLRGSTWDGIRFVAGSPA